MKPHPPLHQQGAAMLIWVLALAMLAALASTHTSHMVLQDVAVGQAIGQSQRARWAAQAALATAQAAVLTQMDTGLATAPWDAGGQACPADVQGPQWQCGSIALPNEGDTSSPWRSQTMWLRDVSKAPHMIEIRASATHPLGSAAHVRERMWVPVWPRMPQAAPQAALVLNGCLQPSGASAWRICPAPQSGAAACSPSTGVAVHTHAAPDSNHNGTTDPSERTACLPLAAAQWPAGGQLTSSATAAPRNPCDRATWRGAFGQTSPQQMRAWSQAQERQGLTAHTTPARSVYWIDSPAPWGQSLGQADAPVLLVFSALACASRCPSLAAGVRIYGTVYADAGCDDHKLQGWQAGWVQGQVLLEAGLLWPGGASTVMAAPHSASAYTLHWPEGADAGVAQRVHGSHWLGTPP